MNVKSLLRRLSLVGGASSVLVCETDGFGLRGAVLGRHGEQIEIEHTAQSEALEYRQAVQEVVQALQRQGWKGKRAVLLTPAVFSGLVELPVSPDAPRTDLQMQELIRWELEPVMMQHAASWSIGQLLLVLGYITPEQITDVLERQQGKLPKGSLGDGHGVVYSFKRFGELAVEMSFVKQEQVDECLTRQGWLRSDAEGFTCGWLPQRPRKAIDYGDMAIDYQDDADAGADVYSWLASGANVGVIRQWQQAFALQKVQLETLYPLVGAAAELLPEDDGVLLLESLHHTVAGLRLRAGVLDVVRLQQQGTATLLQACLESYHDLIAPEVKEVWLTGRDVESNLNELSTLTGRTINHLQESTPQVGAGMMSVARLQLLAQPARFTAGVSVRGPQPPMWQRVQVRAIAAAALIVLTLLALEVSLYVRQDLARTENRKATEAKRQFDAVVAAAQKKVDTVNKLKEEIAADQTALQQATDRFDFFAIELPERSVFVQTLLTELQGTVTEDVIINMLEETPNLGFRIAGWALSETSAFQFIQAFQGAMQAHGMDVSDPIVRAQTGVLGLAGYGFSFRLTKVEENPPAAGAAQSKTRQRAAR